MGLHLTGSSVTQLNNAFVAPRGKTSTGPAAPLPFHNAKDYGAVGDGTTDDAAAIQAALNAAGVGGRVVVPPGIYKIVGTLSTPQFSTIEGSTTEFGVGNDATTELRWTAAPALGTGITAGVNSTLRNLVVRGPGTATGSPKGITGASVRVERVSILNWFSGSEFTNAYYAQFSEVEWSRNGTGLTLTGCYNVNLYGPRFECSSTVSPTTRGTAVNGAARSLNIYGGSIESYASGILVKSAQAVGLYGVYFETGTDAAAIGINAFGKTQTTINAFGCMVYLNGHAQWVRQDTSTSSALNAGGNHFVCPVDEASVAAPTAYYFGTGSAVNLQGDNWAEVGKVGSNYASVASGLMSDPGYRIAWPSGSHVSYGGTFTDGARRIVEAATQTLAANGAVTFDAKVEVHRVTLNANATSSTITNPVRQQECTITFQQDATGGRTYVWPTKCKFAGNAAPSDTTASTRTTARFRYDSSVDRWYELSRAVAVPLS